uniref:Bis(5'-nucleosyl)-tetraphosphatase [asymmetrical] n=1 Tax=Ditylenchus dipsaci TaxID=166011 RepID=A0A915E1D8_9BILA
MTDQLERSAGILVYRKTESGSLYLLLQASYAPYHWSPPKGHLEEKEVEIEAALRETKEESGIVLTAADVDKTFRHSMQYPVKDKEKEVTYFIAQYFGPEQLEMSEEHTVYKWATIKEAIELVNFEPIKTMLLAADEYISTIDK